jgi:large subunit ribosomal protein L6
MGPKNEFIGEIEIPSGTTVTVDKGIVCVKGKSGENKKNLFNKKVSIEVKEGKVLLSTKKASKREKKIIGTFKAHIKNMIKAASEGVIYKLKICSGHFPMNVSVEKNEFVIKNFLGEKIPRKIKIKEGADVKVEGDIINVSSSDKEIAGQFAASIEQLTRRTKYDKRIFMDGIWIIDKDGKGIK